jgi:hypothetical protein
VIQDFSRDVIQADVTGLISDWREYAAMRRVEDYENLFGDELSVPIIYEPV